MQGKRRQVMEENKYMNKFISESGELFIALQQMI